MAVAGARDQQGAGAADRVRVGRASCLFCGLAAAVTALAVAPRAFPCGRAGYAYAGVESASPAYGVGARVTAISQLAVKGGQVAGWVGVGGSNEGPNGTDEWIQVGLSGFPGSPLTNLYYEVKHPGATPIYVELESGLPPGASRRVAVLEMAGHRNWWRVWIDGHPASKPVELPGSHGSWRAVATVEDLSVDGAACNSFGYRFDEIVVAKRPGGAWNQLANAFPIVDGDLRVSRPTPTTLVATFASAPAATGPTS
jgi:hypothetical protein